MLGVGEFTIHQVTGLSLAHVFFVSLVGAFSFSRGGYLQKHVVFALGFTLLLGMFAGSVFSAFVMGEVLMAVYALVLTFAIIIMVKPERKMKNVRLEGSIDTSNSDNDNCDIKEEQLTFLETKKDKVVAGFLGLFIGGLSGLIGVGGASILIPAMNFFLAIPIKICIGNSLGILIMGSAAGFFGKAITGQVPFYSALFLVLGAVPGVWMGTILSMKTEAGIIRKILIIILIATLVRILMDLI